MNKKFDSMGVIFEKQIVNDHIIFSPIHVARCTAIDDYIYDVEFLGETASIYEGDYSDQDVSIGFVIKNEDLIRKYGSLEDGIIALQEDTYPYILIQAYDDIMNITRTYKVDMFTSQIYKIAEFYQDEEDLRITNEQIDITNDKNFKNFNLSEAISSKKEQFNNNGIPNEINIKQLYLAIKESIIGQDKAVKQIISTIDRNYSVDNYRNKTNILLIGPSGSGKTEIFRTIAETINVPITIEDSEQFSAVGYEGNSVDKILVNLYEKAHGNLEAAEHGIVALDEIDKKVTGQKGDVSGERVLNSLLTMMEGSIYRINTGNDFNPNYVMFDTSRVTFILAGACSDLVRKQKGMGINSELEVTKKYKDISIDDLVRYGFTRETLRRVSIYCLCELTVEDLIQIMKDGKNSALKEYIRYAKKKGVKLYIDDGAIRKIAEIASEKNTGASGIKSTLDELLNDAFFEIGMHSNTYSSIKITEKSIEKDPPYILRKKRNTKH